MDKIYTLLEDKAFLQSIYAFSYSRTNNTHEAEDLASEIILKVLKSSTKNSNIQYPHGFVWTIARRVYADYCANELYHYIKKLVPEHLIGEYHIFTQMSASGLLDSLVEKCIESGILNIPNKLCAEGMLVIIK